jgi:hypothetical protein
MVEALRRRLRFLHNATGGQEITKQWTGLGSASAHKPATKAGFMERATNHPSAPRCDDWWKLTEKGARVIAYWIGQGFTFEQIEAGKTPSHVLPLSIL